MMDALRMTTQAAEEYLAVGVTTASAGGMPTSVATLLGVLSNWNQFPQRVALFPLFEEVGEALFLGETALEQFEAGRVSAPRVKIIADGSIQGYTGYLTEPYYVPFKGDASYRGYREKRFFVRSPDCISGGYRSRFTAMVTRPSTTVWMRSKRRWPSIPGRMPGP